MSKNLHLLAVLALSACATDPVPVDHTVTWSLDNVEPTACTSIEVYVVSAGEGVHQSLPCTATTTMFQWTADDVPTAIQVDAMYWFIPQGCESMSCWVQRAMASGTAEFDETTDTTAVVLEPVIQPF
jgi:hypothetical protein